MTVKRRTRWGPVSRVLLVLWVLVAHEVSADGAFPVATQVFLPAAHPHRIIMGTNIGLYISEDDGSSWRVVPELTSSSHTNLGFVWNYQMGPDETPLRARLVRNLPVDRRGLHVDSNSVGLDDVYGRPVC